MNDTITAEQNVEGSQMKHLIPDREIHLKDLKGSYRFAEVALFTGSSPENAVANFYNSTGIDDPIPSHFASLDQAKIAEENEAIGAFLNPPRYWMFDEFDIWEVGDDRDFGGIKMTWMGVVPVAALKKAITEGNYSAGYIHRDNAFTYSEGKEVYLLDAPDGETFVMQSYNAHTDDGLAAVRG
jgi:hypothetical protein